jgi:hypothetical protein
MIGKSGKVGSIIVETNGNLGERWSRGERAMSEGVGIAVHGLLT